MSTGPDILGQALDACRLLTPTIEESDAIDSEAIRSLHGEPMSPARERLLSRFVERAGREAA